MSTHDRPAITTPPFGVCMKFPILYESKCKEKCNYFETCTNKKKGSKVYVKTK